MASEDSGKFSSTLKVPPLKIVFSSNHNNAVVNISSTLENDSNDPGLSNSKKSQEISVELVNDSNGPSISKELNLNANQRITRSSQRAAQQNKSENFAEHNGEESTISENQDKAPESARKVKRRKAEALDVEQDGNQASAQQPITLANIYPTDYQLPSQNSFELYRDIRKRPYKKLLKLNHIQPKAPHGFRNYLLNSGPYLLDGNKLGVGLIGARLENVHSNNINQAKNGLNSTSRVPLRMKLSNLQKLSSYKPSQPRHIAYTIPKVSEAPRGLLGSPLHEMFLEQEKARQQMRMQHLKERERCILTAEQEILRAYNRTAIADVRQKLHLSACTYFYYQERYHYLDEKTCTNGGARTKEVPHCQDNSFLCIEGGDSAKTDQVSNISTSKDSKNSSTETSKDKDVNSTKVDEKIADADVQNASSSTEDDPQVKKEKVDKDTSSEDDRMVINLEETPVKSEREDTLSNTNGKTDTNDGSGSDCDTVMTQSDTNSKDATEEAVSKDGDVKESDKNKDQTKNLDLDSDNSISEPLINKEDPTRSMSDEDLQIFNKEAFLNQLQEIDDKWDKIKTDMLVRHRNEADSLHAVQTLEWEWKAKEIGACDVRLSLKIESEYVPRVEVALLDY